MNSKVRFEITHRGQVAHIKLAAPKANILDRAMMVDLIKALEGLRWDGELKIILLDSEGPHFSFGASVAEHMPDQIGPTLLQLRELLHAFALIPAVTIATVRGQCLGGGFELALACDLIVADETAQFALPEIKLGVFPPAGAVLLPVRLGASRAAELVLTGTAWNAAQAGTAGLACKVLPSAEFQEQIGNWLEADFLPRSAVALRYAAQAARRPVMHALENELSAVEEIYINRLMQEPDATEGILAFIEKRQPRWMSGSLAVK
jgi:cyclohexa-1,5-dienecarbonyl-CoA hydratase